MDQMMSPMKQMMGGSSEPKGPPGYGPPPEKKSPMEQMMSPMKQMMGGSSESKAPAPPPGYPPPGYAPPGAPPTGYGYGQPGGAGAPFAMPSASSPPAYVPPAAPAAPPTPQ
jgi:hypothetical protein